MNHMQHSKFQDYFYSLSTQGRKDFARRVKTSVNNIQVNWLRRQNRRHPQHITCFRSTNTQPKSETMLKLAKATNGACTYDDMLDHFYRK